MNTNTEIVPPGIEKIHAAGSSRLYRQWAAMVNIKLAGILRCLTCRTVLHPRITNVGACPFPIHCTRQCRRICVRTMANCQRSAVPAICLGRRTNGASRSRTNFSICVCVNLPSIRPHYVWAFINHSLHGRNSWRIGGPAVRRTAVSRTEEPSSLRSRRLLASSDWDVTFQGRPVFSNQYFLRTSECKLPITFM